MDDFGHWPEDFSGYTHFQVQQWYVKNGRNGQFRKGLKKIVDTLKAANFPNYFGFTSVESGGRGGQITLVFPNKGWSDMVDEDPSFIERFCPVIPISPSTKKPRVITRGLKGASL